jgi:hypothetical protein
MRPILFNLITIFYFSNTMSQQYETQLFEVIKTIGEAEIRFYPSVMKIKANRSNGFGSLFGYISGKNTEGQKIAMTTPVYMQEEEGKKIMEFVLPRKLDNQSTPEALSDNVEVYESKPGYFIAYPFGGYAVDWVANRSIKALKEIIKTNNVSVLGDPILLVYNSPYKVINRKNEILFKVNYDSNLN